MVRFDGPFCYKYNMSRVDIDVLKYGKVWYTPFSYIYNMSRFGIDVLKYGKVWYKLLVTHIIYKGLV